MNFRCSLLVITLPLLAIACSNNGVRCETGFFRSSVNVKDVHFEASVSEIGISKVWINDCARSYAVTRDLKNSFAKANDQHGSKTGEWYYSGELSGKIIYSDHLGIDAIELSDLREVKIMNVRESDELHDRLAGEIKRPRKVLSIF